MIIWDAEFSNDQSKGIGKIMSVNNFNVKIGTGKGVIILKGVSFGDKEVSISKIFTKDNVDTVLG